MKRILSTLLVLCLAAVLTVPALASGEAPDPQLPTEADVGSFGPDDIGTFDPFSPGPEPAEVLDDAPAEAPSNDSEPPADAEYPTGAVGGVMPAGNKQMTDELEAIIEKVNENFEDEGYEGRGLLSTQVVSGTMYTFVVTHWVFDDDSNLESWYAVLEVWEHPDGSCTVEDERRITFDEAEELLGFNPLFPEAGSEPGVIVSEFFELAWVVNWKGLYVRVAETVEIDGQTSLYVSQGVLEENGNVVIPMQNEPDVKITGVSVALVPTIEDIFSPTPNVVAANAMFFEEYVEDDDTGWLDLLPSWLRNLDLGRIVDWLRSLAREDLGELDPLGIGDAAEGTSEEVSSLSRWIIRHS